MSNFKYRKKYKIDNLNNASKKRNYYDINLTKMAKRELMITLVSILGVTLLSVGSAFAIFSTNSKSSNYNVIKVGTLDIDFGTDSDNTINLNGQYPVSDDEGLQATPYTFTIKNTGTITSDYKISLQDDTDMITQDNCSTSQLDKKYIKYSLSKNTSSTLSAKEADNYVITENSLKSGDSITYRLWVWISKDAGNDALGKHYHGKIVVEGNNTQKQDTTQTTGIATEVLLSKANTTISYLEANAEQKKQMWESTTIPGTEVQDNAYRFIGITPNNYAILSALANTRYQNWRIVGVFEIDGTKYVKLMLAKPLDGQVFDTSSNAIWSDSSLYSYLNNDFINDEINASVDNGITQIAINNGYWYQPAFPSSIQTIPANYLSTIKNISEYTHDYIGLIDVDDYVLAASGNESTGRNSCLTSEIFAAPWPTDCINTSWLLKEFSEPKLWTTASNGTTVLTVQNGKLIAAAPNTKGIATPLSIYLPAGSQIISGDGSSNDPYVIETNS